MKRTLLLCLSVLVIAATGCAQSAKQTTVKAAELTPATKVDAKYTVKTIDSSLKGEDILKAISANYAGKVTLIDFWATWCGPCRMAMKEVDKIKPALQQKGVAFVYVTGETSPKADWDALIPNIHGDHYRLTNSQWEELCTLLKMPGIPSYMLLNKDGSVAYSNVTQGGYPGNEKVENEIEVALGK